MRMQTATARVRGRVVLLLVAAALACGGPPPRARSLVLIAIDTLRADHLGVYGYERPTSPELDRWAARGALFERALASSPWTLPSFASLYTGQHPSRHAAGWILDRSESPKQYAGLSPEVPTLAEILRANGYATHALVTNPWLHAKLGMARGFETYDYATTEITHIRDAKKTVSAALRWLDHRDGRPFLLVVHLMDPHLSYAPRGRYRGRFTADYRGPLRYPVENALELRARSHQLDADDRGFIAGAYDEELLYVDTHVGRLLNGLEERGLFDEALVVLTSDHGEEFFEHGGFEHGHTVYQELLHVPLLVWGPEVRPRRIATAVSHVDVLPTVLDALDLPVPTGVAGESLWSALARGTPLAERALVAEASLYGPERKAVVRWPWKAATGDDGEEPQLFHLEADPGERRDLASEAPARLADLMAELERLTGEAAPPPPASLTPEMRSELRALGYAE